MRKPAAKSRTVAPMLAGESLLADMQAFRAKISASPAMARQVLVGIGVLTRTGRIRTLIRR